MSLETETFGFTPGGNKVDRVTLGQGQFSVSVITWGATLQDVRVPDRRGVAAPVLLGLPRLEDYLAGHPYLGSTVGRYANRLGRGRFPLEGRRVQTAVNEGRHCLHGGPEGFDSRLWTLAGFEDRETLSPKEVGASRVKLILNSADGDQGFPGGLTCEAEYTLRADGRLTIRYKALSDASTVVNMTNHAYWNLAGNESDGFPPVGGHYLQVKASRLVEVDEEKIPTGRLSSLDRSPWDLRREKQVSRLLQETGGVDHCYALDPDETWAARLRDEPSGRTMEVRTNQPGIQVYTADSLQKRHSTGTYSPRQALCLETQNFPDAPNHPSFPEARLLPGETYAAETELYFSIEEA